MSLWKSSQPGNARDETGYKAGKGRQSGTNRKNALVTQMHEGNRETSKKAAKALKEEFGEREARKAVRDTSGLSTTRKDSLINRLRGS